MTEKRVTIEKATDAAIAPYGDLVEIAGVSPDFDSDVFSFWNDVSVGSFDGGVSFGMVNTKPGDMVAPMLERHVKTTETLIALDAEIVLVLGEPTGGDVPNLENVKAFSVAQGSGVTLERGTWHYVPLVPSEVEARTLVVFRQGTPGDDLQIHQLAEVDGVTVRAVQPRREEIEG